MSQPYRTMPSGWYCVAFSGELPPGRVLPRRYFGRDLVLWRTASGLARLADAWCPHLGAHLGHGGRVEGELLRCPFHGFQFDSRGACAATPYGHKAPPGARLGTWEVREMHGVVLAWFDPGGAAPGWEVADQETAGWSRLAHGGLTLRSHPQETSENSVDFGHFSEIHGFRRAAITRPLAIRGPLLTIGYTVETRGMEVAFDIEVHGLGYSRVEGRLPRLGVEMRHLVLATPIDEEHVELRLASRVRRLRFPGLTPLALRAVFSSLCREVRQDSAVWRHKRFLERPALAEGDGPIPAYRRWCRQFYGGAVTPAAPAP